MPSAAVAGWVRAAVFILAMGAFAAKGATGPVEEQQLTAPLNDRNAFDFFGNGVAISADGLTAAVASRLADTALGEDSGIVYVFVRDGAAWTLQQGLKAGDGAADDVFGSGVALSADGDTLLVGSPQEDPAAGEDAGSAYVFTRSGGVWTQQQKLNGMGAGEYDYFGTAVDLSDDGAIAVVGANSFTGPFGAGRGAAYVFERSGGSWVEKARLVASDGADGDLFGHSVAVSGDGQTVLVGAYQDDAPGADNKGSAYVFVPAGGNWTEQGKLEDGLDPGGAFFGIAVDLSTDGNTALIGKRFGRTGNGIPSGTAHVFARTGQSWSQTARLEPPSPVASDWFGSSVALSGDGARAVIGVPQLDRAELPLNESNDAGGVMVFSRSGSAWAHDVTFRASDAVGAENFGGAVALADAGGRVLSGAGNDTVDGVSGQGSAYVHVLTASEPEISLFAGAATSGPEILNGQSGVADFGFGGVGTPVTLDFTIQNTGSAGLTVSGITPPLGFEVVNAPATAIAAEATHTFQVRLTGLTAGPFSGLVTVSSDDADEASFEFPVAGEVLPADYHGWATGHGLTGVDLDPLASPGMDGVRNLTKFAFNLNPTRSDLRVLEPGTGTAGLPVFSRSGSGEGSRFRVEFIRRSGTGYEYSPVHGTTLTTWAPFTAAAVVTAIDGTWERVVIEEPFDGTFVNAMFGRVEISPP